MVKSKVWEHFVRTSSIEAKCRYCNVILKAESSTSSLFKHLKMKHVHIEFEEHSTQRFSILL